MVDTGDDELRHGEDLADGGETVEEDPSIMTPVGASTTCPAGVSDPAGASRQGKQPASF
jgi:hypothetical protein